LKHTPIVDEIIWLEVQKVKRMLRLDEDVVCVTDKKHWKKLFPKSKPEKVYATAMTQTGYFFLDINECETLRDLQFAIAHELIHLRYPNAKHPKVYKLSYEYVRGRYD